MERRPVFYTFLASPNIGRFFATRWVLASPTTQGYPCSVEGNDSFLLEENGRPDRDGLGTSDSLRAIFPGNCGGSLLL